MKVDYKQAYIYDIDRLVDEFYRLLDTANCPAGATIPDAVLVRAVMNQVMGYSPQRGTAARRVLSEMQLFGLPTLVAEELFDNLCKTISQRIGSLLGNPPFHSDHCWHPVDNTSILIMEK